MIASWRGLAVAVAIAAALAVVVVVDLARRPAAVDRALVPGFDPDHVTELLWARAGQPAVDVVRAGDGWETRAPSGAGSSAVSHVPVEPGTVGDVLAALRGARWHRRGHPGPALATLTVVAEGGRHVLDIGVPIPGTEQTWITADGRGVLVDSWVARALDPDLLALRIKTPLAGARRAETITLEGKLGSGAGELLQLEGHPRRLHGPGGFVIAADIAGELERALGDVTIVRIPDGPSAVHGVTIPGAAHGVTIPSAAHGLTIRLGGADSPRGAPSAVQVMLGGSCPGAPALVAVSGTLGDGCVEPAAALAVDHAIDRLQERERPEVVIERRPIPFEPTRLELADGVALDTASLRVGDHAAEPARVAELLAALAAPAEVVRLPTTAAIRTLVASGRDGAAVTLDLFADHVLARHGEPVGLRPAPGAWSLVVRPSRELRDPTLWLEEPTTITAVRIDDVRYQRGAVIGAWSRQPAGGSGAAPGTAPTTAPKTSPGIAPATASEVTQLEALVGLLAAPRSLGFVDDEVAAAHRVTLTVTPPAGAPTEHVLVLGAARPAGCRARLDRDMILLPEAVCAQVTALAK